MKIQLVLFKTIKTTIILTFLATPLFAIAQNGPYIHDEYKPSGDSEMKITFPPHYCTGTVQNIEDLSPDKLPEGYNRPVVINAQCGNASIRHIDEVESSLGGKQVRIIRRWEVCDPCHNQKCNQGVQIIQSKIAPNSPPLEDRSIVSNINTFELYQNKPNPFSGQTFIGFTLPEATDITFTIHQVDGRILHLVEGNYPKGYSEITIEAGTLPTEGFLFYTLTTDKNRATKRMVKMD